MASESTLPETEEAAEAAARLEAALERIAHGIEAGSEAQGHMPEHASADGARDRHISEAVTRLEALIAHLRTALARPGPG
ncbi:MAG TPA: hypothetical protein VMA86_07615 [Acetobacteraceae bacterium]|nr:hypothetical protein [Acetobacteraceae bacterium]